MKGKTYSLEFKEQIVKKALGLSNHSLVARKHEIAQTLVSR